MKGSNYVTDIRFETDTPEVPGAGERREIIAAMRNRPGVTVLLGKKSSKATAASLAWKIRNAQMSMHMFAPAGSFEASVRTIFEENRIYIRYVGHKEEES